MTTKKDGLPEMNVSTGLLADLASKLVHVRSDIAGLQTFEKDHKKGIEDEAKNVRTVEEAKGSFIGLIKIMTEGATPVQVQFKIQNGALALSDEANLDNLFGAARPLLFERDHAVTEVVDPGALIDELKSSGKNPWDYLNVSVKPGLDRAVCQSPSVVATEAFLPKKGFLNTLNEIAHTLKAEAKDYIQTYLGKCLKPTVVVGSKG